MRRWVILLVTLALAACDSADDAGSRDTGGGGGAGEDAGGSGGPGVTGQCYPVECTGVEEFEDCLCETCFTVMTACYGDGVFDGEYSGPCAPLIECARGCECDDACNHGCDALVTAECQGALTEVQACAQANHCLDAMNCTAGE